MSAAWKNTGDVVESGERIAHITFKDGGQAEIRFYGGSKEKAEERFRQMLAAPELLEALKGCLAYIEQSLAHEGRSLNSDQLRQETKRIQDTVSKVQTGFYWGPLQTADLQLARAAIAKATRGAA